ncbi:MAG: hypothetical protein M5U28_21265 [Sandaracinaceae bacterium]|nr:hypothetical protein [Sandaracinaceae bacterium]
MGFRDDREALSAKARALEEQLEDAKAELARAQQDAERAASLERRVRELEALIASDELEGLGAEKEKVVKHWELAHGKPFPKSGDAVQASSPAPAKAASVPAARASASTSNPARQRWPWKEIAKAAVAVLIVAPVVGALVYEQIREPERAHPPAPAPAPPPVQPEPSSIHPPRFDQVDRTGIVISASETAPLRLAQECSVSVVDGDTGDGCRFTLVCPRLRYPDGLGANCTVGPAGLERIRDVWESRQVAPGFTVDSELALEIDVAGDTFTVRSESERGSWNAALQLQPPAAE